MPFVPRTGFCPNASLGYDGWPTEGDWAFADPRPHLRRARRLLRDLGPPVSMGGWLKDVYCEGENSNVSLTRGILGDFVASSSSTTRSSTPSQGHCAFANGFGHGARAPEAWNDTPTLPPLRLLARSTPNNATATTPLTAEWARVTLPLRAWRAERGPRGVHRAPALFRVAPHGHGRQHGQRERDGRPSRPTESIDALGA